MQSTLSFFGHQIPARPQVVLAWIGCLLAAFCYVIYLTCSSWSQATGFSGWWFALLGLAASFELKLDGKSKFIIPGAPLRALIKYGLIVGGALLAYQASDVTAAGVIGAWTLLSAYGAVVTKLRAKSS
jgi:TRAP-type C4-dicarboxylate transport system permease small subunit